VNSLCSSTSDTAYLLQDRITWSCWIWRWQSIHPLCQHSSTASRQQVMWSWPWFQRSYRTV